MSKPPLRSGFAPGVCGVSSNGYPHLNMDNELLHQLSKKASRLWANDDYVEADKLFKKIIPYLDPAHWKTASLYAHYGLTLEGLGKIDEATAYFEKSLYYSVQAQTHDTGAATFARFALGEHLFRKEQFKEALMAITPSLESKCESQWLILSLAAKIYYKQSMLDEFEKATSALLFAAPKGKYKSLKQIRELIILSVGSC